MLKLYHLSPLAMLHTTLHYISSHYLQCRPVSDKAHIEQQEQVLPRDFQRSLFRIYKKSILDGGYMYLYA